MLHIFLKNIGFKDINYGIPVCHEYKNAKCSKDPTCVIFSKCRAFKDIKYDMKAMNIMKAINIMKAMNIMKVMKFSVLRFYPTTRIHSGSFQLQSKPSFNHPVLSSNSIKARFTACGNFPPLPVCNCARYNHN